MLCASIHRLAAFGAPGIVCLTGTGLGRDPDDAARARRRRACSTLAREAELAGTRIALEPYQRVDGEDWTIATTIPEALELIDEAGGSPALGLQFDVWHLWNTPDLCGDIARELDRIVGVHVCDVRDPTRGWADRVLPGDGIADLADDPRRPRRGRLARPVRPRDLLRQRHVRHTPTRFALGRPGRRPRPAGPRVARAVWESGRRIVPTIQSHRHGSVPTTKEGE